MKPLAFRRWGLRHVRRRVGLVGIPSGVLGFCPQSGERSFGPNSPVGNASGEAAHDDLAGRFHPLASPSEASVRTSTDFSPATLLDDSVERLLTLLFSDDEPTAEAVADR